MGRIEREPDHNGRLVVFKNGVLSHRMCTCAIRRAELHSWQTGPFSQDLIAIPRHYPDLSFDDIADSSIAISM